MKLMYKQLSKQVLRGKIFICLLIMLTTLTSLSFFFVRFSIDGNLAHLDRITLLHADQIRYQTALESNITLAYTFLLSMTGLSCFIFTLFFYRFYISNRKQIGCIKSIGFSDNDISIFYILFTVTVSLIGSILGMFFGYYLSDVLINANIQSYNVDNLVKTVLPKTVLLGIGAPTIVLCFVAFLCSYMFRGKDISVLLSGQTQASRLSVFLKISDKFVSIIPAKDKFSLRIALRKPISVLLILGAVLSFSTCLIISRSLNLSSQIVFDSQVEGREYAFDVSHSEIITELPDNSGITTYLTCEGRILINDYEIEQNFVAMHQYSDLFVLLGDNKDNIIAPERGEIVIGPNLSETFGVNPMDVADIYIGNERATLIVREIARNAESNTIYIHIEDLTEILNIDSASYNGVYAESLFSLTQLYIDEDTSVISQEDRLEELAREAVSNNTSAVINQIIGAFVGCMLIFLAIYVNFLDNTRDILILHMMGYQTKDIRKMLIDVYLPVVWCAFILSLFPAIKIVQNIHRSLSISTKDYMPFAVTPLTLAVIFVLLNVLYFLVQSIFGLLIKRIIAKENITEYTAFE